MIHQQEPQAVDHHLASLLTSLWCRNDEVAKSSVGYPTLVRRRRTDHRLDISICLIREVRGVRRFLSSTRPHRDAEFIARNEKLLHEDHIQFGYHVTVNDENFVAGDETEVV